MAAIDSPRQLLLVTLFITALTLSVSVGTDGTSSVPSISDRDPPFKPLSSMIERSPDGPDNINDRKLPWHTSKVAEGGPIINIEDTAKIKPGESNKSRIRENMPKERNASPSVVARKGVEEKIKPRKGVSQDMEPEKMDTLFNETDSEDAKSMMEIISHQIEATHVNNQSKTSDINILKLNIPTSNPDNNLNHSANSNYSNTMKPANVTMSYIETTNNTASIVSHIEKHIPKPKPTVTTIDGPEVYQSRPSSRRKTSSLGISRKIDYIVPVIITIIALPILGAAMFILYRRGRDCWDKRHYRRMDFLIDGMYND